MLSTASSLTPISRYPTGWLKNGFPWERFERKKITANPQQVVGRLSKSPTLIMKSKDQTPKSDLEQFNPDLTIPDSVIEE